ncbi:MAG TPA: hypothetical protein ENL20_00460, partial [Candidatus Cloacimonetes bacterium]|nr:hypothetical protein [Candidatus Cloacimonadota bacterium]
MKQTLFIIFSFVAITLSSQFNEPVMINDNDDFVHLSGQGAYQVIEENIYLTFIRKLDISLGCIFFAYSENNGLDFSFTEVDSVFLNPNEPDDIAAPVLEVSSNGNIIIIYSKKPVYSENIYYSLNKAISGDNGQTFSIETIADNISQAYHFQNSDVLELCYTTGVNSQLSNYNYLTDIEHSENADNGSDPLPFSGQDVLYGSVHSNDDIWIRNLGGWPTFHCMVTTSGRIMDYDTHQPAEQSAPMDDVFLGGYEENVPPKLFEPEATLIQENGLQPFNSNYEIVYVKIDGNSYQSMYGDIELVGIDSFKVYSWFPADAEQANEVINAGGNWYEDSDHIWTNYIPIYDTLWTQGPSGTIQDQSVWVESELWIEGVVGGKQTWGCADTVFVVGDITYQNTPVGEAPDDEDNPNLTDYFGLVSEKKIIIKYKHKDPFNNMELRDDNCDGIYLYGSYAAIGKGNYEQYGFMACHYDGSFSFEYQHPHGSTPDFIAPSPYTGNDTLYSFIDLHKFIFPINPYVPPEISGFNLSGGAPQFPYYMCGFPYESPEYLESFPNNGPNFIYPYGTDYPWYNPVWPESAADIITERGDINLYGSLTQRRRGFAHRSGMDPYNHPQGNSNPNPWNMEFYHYDGHHPSTGYYKNYHYDTRLEFVNLVDFPTVNYFYSEQNLIISKSENNGETFEIQLEQTIDYPILGSSFAANENTVVYAYQLIPSELMILNSNDNGETFEEYPFEFYDHSENILLKNIKLLNSDIYLLAADNDQDLIIKLNVYENYYGILDSFDSVYHVSDFNISNSGEKIYVNTILNEGHSYIEFLYTNGSDDFVEYFQWLPDFIEEDVNSFTSKIAVNFNDTDSVYATFLKVEGNEYDDFWGDIYLTSGRLDSLTTKTDEDFDLPEFFISNYPNPFNPEVNISFSLP